MNTNMLQVSRRHFLDGIIAAASAPMIIPSSALGLDGRSAPSNRIVIGSIGVGGRGSGNTKSMLNFNEVQVVSVCDVRKDNRDRMKFNVDKAYGNTSCTAVNDFREITRRTDIDAIIIGTPDHWHVPIAIDALRHGKDVFSEKPETLTVREGRLLADVIKRTGRVYSGGSQRVWGDYNWCHRMVRGGAIGDVKEVWVNVGGTSLPINLPEEPVMEGLDWNMWLGPAPWVPFNKQLLNFRRWRDYSGGGMTDWGAHTFGGALFACNLHMTGPVEIHPPDGKDYPLLTYIFSNGIRMYHGGKSGKITFRGTKMEINTEDARRIPAPQIVIPNYSGTGGILGDFLNCVKTRQQPFRHIETAHRAVSHCHLGNICYWLNRPLKWDPVQEVFINDEEANRWLERPSRSPWQIV
ncbi:MAG: Gfo/Idh/MocA family oxidoreductase [bacterium]